MMYWLYARHHVLPSAFSNMGSGEKIVLRAFFEYEVEAENRENEKIRREMKNAGR